MKRTRNIGVSLAAVCAIFALTATGALAFESLPHYGQCNKVEVGSTLAKYSNASCTKESALGAFFWHPLTSAVKFNDTKETGTGKAVLETAAGVRVECTGQTAKGEFGPGDQVKNVIDVFTGCTSTFAPTCTSAGQPPGQIVTNALHGEPGIVKLEPNQQNNLDATDLRAELAGANIAEFTCAPLTVEVRGGIVVDARASGIRTTNKMLNKIKTEYVGVGGGVQEPINWTPNGGGISNSTNALITEQLETKLGTGAFETSSLSLTTVRLTNPKTVKVELRQCGQTISCPN